MLPSNIFRPPLTDAFKNEDQLGISESWKGTAETNTYNFCLENEYWFGREKSKSPFQIPENKLTIDDYGKITIKIPQNRANQSKLL